MVPFYCCLVLLIISTIVRDSQQAECIDARRTLRCVLPSNCPSKLTVSSKTCPTGRICCRKDKVNPYLPIRTMADKLPELAVRGRALQGGKLLPSTTTENSKYLYKDRIVFPSESDYEEHNLRVLPLEKDPLVLKAEPLSSTKDNDVRPDVKSLRKSAKYCREYRKLTVDVGYATPLLKNLIPLSYEMENCEPKISALVVGGTNATISEYPHMVALGYNHSRDIEYLCGGSLISDQFVLTAAHCALTKWGAPVVVYLGATELYTENAKVVLIDKIYTHPDYNAPAIYDDIALVKLLRKVQLTPKLRPACLPTEVTSAQYPGHVAVATGWGRIGFGREASKSLRQVSLKIIDNKKCGQYYPPSAPIENGIVPNMICAGGNVDVTEDTCQGDSGGPLQSFLVENSCMLQIVGITSFGKSCGAGVPGVYTRVASYLQWIEDTVWP